MASMLAKYDEVHGLKKRMSPQRSNRKTINSIDSLREKVFPKLWKKKEDRTIKHI